MSTDASDWEFERRQELKAFLRAHRDRVPPPADLSASRRRRRTPGLRREEVAELAGVSSIWYTWLEMGRPIKVSANMLERVATALRLDGDETSHLFTLARKSEPRQRPILHETVPDTVQNILAKFDNPACVFGARLDILAANEHYRALYDHPEGEEGWQRNVLWRAFNDSKKRATHVNWHDDVANLTAMLRINYGHHVGDPRFEDLIAELQRSSPIFCEIWTQHYVVRRLVREVLVDFETRGRVVVEVTHFPMPSDPLQTIVFCSLRS